jgi:hypothetical protein
MLPAFVKEGNACSIPRFGSIIWHKSSDYGTLAMIAAFVAPAKQRIRMPHPRFTSEL